MSTSRRRRQNGQTIVVVGVSMIVLLAMTGLVLMSGTMYWDRRHLQELADSAVLAAALKVPNACSSSQWTNAINEVDRVLGLQLGTRTGISGPSGDCTTHYTATLSYPGAVTAIVNYPYKSGVNRVEVIVQQTIGVQLAAFIGATSATAQARAVAQYQAGLPTGTYAVFAKTFVGCQGSSTINVNGSVYSHDLPTGNGQCRVNTHLIQDRYGNYQDYGNFVIYQDGVGSWGCVHWCADGYELAGHSAPICGITGSTQYLAGYPEGSNTNPCVSGSPPPAPNLSYPAYPDPNLNYPGQVGTPKYTSSSSGCDPAPSAPDGHGYIHYSPNCYSTIDLTGKNAILDPGFYYIGFNSGSGICLGGSGNLLGTDVTLEFVGSANFTSLKCGLDGACGSSCGFGADPTQPPPDQPSQATYFAAPDPVQGSSWCTGSCPLLGLLIYNAGTGSFYVKGSGELSWLKGSVYWPNGQCTWWANGTGAILGQLACDSVYLQGGASSSGAGVAYSGGAVNQAPAEAALIE